MRKIGPENAITFFSGDETYPSLRIFRGSASQGKYGYITRTTTSGSHYFPIVIGPTGQVGFGMGPATKYQIAVSGKVYCTEVYETGSDIKLKGNIKPLKKFDIAFDSLQPKSYQYKKAYRLSQNELSDDVAIVITDTLLEKETFGFVAQDVQKYFPELVSMGQDSSLAVNYDGFIPILWQSNQELRKEIKILNQKLSISNPNKTNNVITIKSNNNIPVYIQQKCKKHCSGVCYGSYRKSNSNTFTKQFRRYYNPCRYLFYRNVYYFCNHKWRIRQY